MTTDFGSRDTYVAQMKGIILSINPATMIFDVTHEVPPQDVLRGSMALGEMWRAFPVGTIHVAVVDPGVGTDRSMIAARCDDRLFVLPNNGLLSHSIKASSSHEFIELQNKNYWRAEVSNTFHGRDIMAPVAAHLSLGVGLDELGPPATDVVLLDLPAPSIEGRRLIGQIVGIDGFGNLLTNIDLAHIDQIPEAGFIISCNKRQIAGVREAYAQHPPGTLIALIGSQGCLELATVNGNAAIQLGARIGDTVSTAW
ncbi:MAG: SAM-dependent chlorinase/fluorinase [Planctomycetes bacterium]|nr:SAM-dependent chlorinase/fluorinase [Planctomycetota bacterium]